MTEATATTRVGTTGAYVDTSGREKAAIVFATHESVEADNEAGIPQPGEGFVHLYLFGYTGIQVRVDDIPTRTVAESIPDYTVEGNLVGFFDPR